MSAIAQILHDRGEIVSGSDRQESDMTARLRADGMRIAIGHAAENVDGADVVIYTPAVAPDNPEILKARELGIPVIERPAMLGRIMEPFKHRVAVSGTHGKTTTTSMIEAILDRAGLDASVLIGGDVKSLGGNVRLGKSSIVVTEACEAFESFLHLYPSIAVITNIDADHLDYYGTIEHIEDSFRQFIAQVDEDGCVVACWDDPRVRKVAKNCGRQIVSFGLEGAPEYLARDVDAKRPDAEYTLVRSGIELGRVRLGVPGMQNITDSLAAAAVAFELGAGFEHVQSALRKFTGAGRRFEVLYDDGRVMVVDDYAHHPAEITATLESARAAFGRRMIAVFQPHLYSRTKLFIDEFADALSAANEVVICPVYAAREQPSAGITADKLADRMREKDFTNVRYASNVSKLHEELAGGVKDGDLVLILGAGDIRAVGEQLSRLLADGK